MAVQPEEALRRLLLDDADVAALTTRIYPQAAPQKATLPYCVYQRIDVVHNHHMTAASGACFARIQLDLFDDDYSDLMDLVDKVRLATDGFRGNVTVGGNTFTVRTLHLDSDNTDLVQPTDGRSLVDHRASLDFLIGFDETVPTF